MCALDSMRNPIQKNDSVRIADGVNKGKRGTIVHIYKNIAFLYNPEQIASNGLFVDKTRNLVLLGAELLKGNNEVSKEGRRKMGKGNSRQEGPRYSFVRITEGPYKGYQGIVVEQTKEYVKIELASKSKTVIVGVNGIEDASKKVSMAAEPVAAPEIGSKTPAYLPQSPHWVASTPAPEYDRNSIIASH